MHIKNITNYNNTLKDFISYTDSFKFKNITQTPPYMFENITIPLTLFQILH